MNESRFRCAWRRSLIRRDRGFLPSSRERVEKQARAPGRLRFNGIAAGEFRILGEHQRNNRWRSCIRRDRLIRRRGASAIGALAASCRFASVSEVPFAGGHQSSCPERRPHRRHRLDRRRRMQSGRSSRRYVWHGWGFRCWVPVRHQQRALGRLPRR